jgi:hypothetical protein
VRVTFEAVILLVLITHPLFAGTVLCVFLHGAGIVGQRRAQDSDELANPSPEDSVPVDETQRDAADKKLHA